MEKECGEERETLKEDKERKRRMAQRKRAERLMKLQMRPLAFKHIHDCVFTSSQNMFRELLQRCHVVAHSTVSLYSTGGSAIAFALTEACREAQVHVCVTTSCHELASNLVKQYLPEDAWKEKVRSSIRMPG